MERKRSTLFVGGQARLPKELSMGEVFQVIVELDPDTAKVIQASCHPCPPMIENFLRELMVGMNLETEADHLLEVIQQRLYHKSQKAILAAIRDLIREYKESQKGIPVSTKSDS